MALQTSHRTEPARTGISDRGRRRVPQGDVLVAWALSAFIIIAGGAPYARLDPVVIHADTTRHGVMAGLSRVVMAANMPVALIAIAVVLISVDTLSRRAWWIGGPAVAMCAFLAWPGVIDDRHMDARAVNLVPAAGVALAAGLSIARGRWPVLAGRALRPRLQPIWLVILGIAALVALLLRYEDQRHDPGDTARPDEDS